MGPFWWRETTKYLWLALSCLSERAQSFQGKCYVWKVNDESSGLPRFQAVTKFHAHNKYLTRCLLSPDAKSKSLLSFIWRY
jgi:hypothetical protein